MIVVVVMMMMIFSMAHRTDDGQWDLGSLISRTMRHWTFGDYVWYFVFAVDYCLWHLQ